MGSQEYINEQAKEAVANSQISENELINLQKRGSLMDTKRLEYQIVHNEMQIYMNTLLEKYGKDPSKSWLISFETGQIEEKLEKPEVEKPTILTK
jgi:hypothetical protein